MFLSLATLSRKAAVIDTVRSHGTECTCRICNTFFAAPIGESANAVLRMEASDELAQHNKEREAEDGK